MNLPVFCGLKWRACRAEFRLVRDGDEEVWTRDGRLATSAPKRICTVPSSDALCSRSLPSLCLGQDALVPIVAYYFVYLLFLIASCYY